ncbi:MAG: sigma-70 family RNA polymerase sigma factor [Leptospiraceae bacterium]|nr:sigma-70 family RNA polymerase sigma factor [Leptospiraceae bacterium]
MILLYMAVNMQDKNQAFEQLYLRNRERIFEYVYKLVGNEDIAMEIMQESFTNYYKSYSHSAKSESESLMLLYTIAKNLCSNHLKKFSTKKEFYKDNIESSEDTSIHFEKHTELTDLENHLYECLGDLPSDLRAAFLLRITENMSLAEISKIMGVSISKASRLVVKATERMIQIAKQKGIQI